MLGAAAARVRRPRAARGLMAPPARLVVCPTPIGNLEDVTLRVLAALREADVVACEDTRRTRVLLDRYGVEASLVSYHEHNERARAPSWSSGCARARRSRSSATPACRWSATPASCSCGRASPRGSPSRCCRGRARRWPRSWPARCRPDRWRFAGFLPRKAGGAARRAVAARRRSSRSSRRAGGGDAGGAGGARPVAARGGLPRADEAPRGGRARHGGGAGRALRGRGAARARSCSWSAGRRRRRGDEDAAARRAAPAGRGRGAGRAGRRRRRASSRATSANALYRALTASEA